MQRDMLKKELAALILSGLVFVCATAAFWWFNLKALATDGDISSSYLLLGIILWYFPCLATGVLVLWNGKWPMDKQQVVLGGVLGFAAVAFGIIGFTQSPEIGRNVTFALGLVGLVGTVIRILLTLHILNTTDITVSMPEIKKAQRKWGDRK